MEIIDLCKNCATTECGHQFHSNCLMRNIAFNGFGCPYCRFEMVEEIDDSDEEDEREDGDDEREEDGEEDEDEENEEDEDYEDGEDDQQELPSFELIQKKFIEKGITYESLIKTIMFNSMIYHKNDDFADYQKCNTFIEELFYETITNYKPEQEEVKSDKNEFNFYFLEDEYSQRKYQSVMETELEKFLDLTDDEEDSIVDDNDVRDIISSVRYLNNRFMVVV
jgi:hypothetical protein